MEAVGAFLAFLFAVAVLLAICFGIKLIIQDARLRGKHANIVTIVCVLFFPCGLIAWLLFRPDPIERPKQFLLRDHRVQ